MTATERPIRAASPLGWGTTVMLGLLGAMGPLSSDLHLPGLPQIAESLDTTDAAAAATVTVCFAGFALGQLLVGGLSDRFGRRGPLLVSLALFTITGALCALAPTIEVLLAARFFQGLFGAGGVVISRAAVRDHVHGSTAAGIYSRLSMVAMVAPIIAPVLGGQVLRFTSWRGLFWTLTAISAALLVLAVLRMRESLPPERRRPAGGQLRLMVRVARHPGFGQHLVMSLCQGAILFSYITMSSLFLQHEYGVGPQIFSLIFAMGAGSMLIGHVVNIRLAPRWGALNTLTGSVVGYFGGCVLLTLAIVAHAPIFVVVAALLITIGALTPATPNNMALAMVPFGAAAGTASALLGAAQQAAGAVIPSVAVQIGSSGTVMALTMLAGASVGVVQVFAAVRPALRRDERPAFEADAIRKASATAAR